MSLDIKIHIIMIIIIIPKSRNYKKSQLGTAHIVRKVLM